MKHLAALLFGVALAAPLTAQATAITAASDFDVTWGLPSPGGGIMPSAVAEFGNFHYLASGNAISFQMRVTNTSTGTSAGVDSRFTSFGWVTAPPTTAASNNGGVYLTATNVSLGPDNLGVCLYSGPNCNGGAQGGLEDSANTGLHGDPTTTGIFTVLVTFSSVVPPLDFSSFDGKFQTARGSVEGMGTVANCVTGCINPTVAPPVVPEPASLGLLGLGFLGNARRFRFHAAASLSVIN